MNRIIDRLFGPDFFLFKWFILLVGKPVNTNTATRTWKWFHIIKHVIMPNITELLTKVL